MVAIQKIPILPLVLYFVFYIISHYIIGKKLEKLKNQLKENIINNKDDIKLNEDIKKWNIYFKWYPAVYVIFVIIMLLI